MVRDPFLYEVRNIRDASREMDESATLCGKQTDEAGEGGVTVDASSLLTVLGKFHNATLAWPAGRPRLYALWRLYFTATFRNNNPSKLRPKSQTLEVMEDARASILVWVQALTTPTATKTSDAYLLQSSAFNNTRHITSEGMPEN